MRDCRGLGTANLPYTIYQTFYQAHDYGRASAAGVVVVIGTIIIANLRAADRVVAVPRGDLPMTSITDTAPVPASRTIEGAPRRTRAPRSGVILGMVGWLIGILFVLPVL